MSQRILSDSEVAGGEGRRNVDHWLSERLGGYRSEQVQNGEQASFYGKFVEVPLHSAEHFARGVFGLNSAELARAADEMKVFGTGLHANEHQYQQQQQQQ